MGEVAFGPVHRDIPATPFYKLAKVASVSWLLPCAGLISRNQKNDPKFLGSSHFKCALRGNKGFRTHSTRCMKRERKCCSSIDILFWIVIIDFVESLENNCQSDAEEVSSHHKESESNVTMSAHVLF